MITKYKYSINQKGDVVRSPSYSFTAIEELSVRLEGVDSIDVITGITNRTLRGEAERSLIEVEDTWFRAQTDIQNMNAERVTLEAKLKSGDSKGNPLTPDMQKVIAARIAELKEGTITIKKIFYNHYNRQNMEVDEVVQTPYTIVLLTRTDLEASNKYLPGLRGVKGAPARPASNLSVARETEIRKELVRQKINVQVGDVPDLLADVSNALAALIKKVAGQSVTPAEDAAITKYVGRQAQVTAILAADYMKK